MRWQLVLALSTLACHRGEPPRPADSNADAAAKLDVLIGRINGVADDPTPLACDQLDAALAGLANSEVGRQATYARAEAALRCHRSDRWQALHEQLADANYVPSLVRLRDDAIEQQQWERALVLVERLAESRGIRPSASDCSGSRSRSSMHAGSSAVTRPTSRGSSARPSSRSCATPSCSSLARR